MKISFCTTCMNRLEHLQQTLPQNLLDNPDRPGVSVEFVVVNYNDTSGMHEWITSDPQIVEAIESGRVRYAHTTEPRQFHMSHAKNMAHRLATGDVVCNLDADNFTGPGFAKALAALFSQNMDLIVSPSLEVARRMSRDEVGFGGRLILSRENFIKLGGYDEKYKGWGFEDTDLSRRARLTGLKAVRFDDMKFLKTIGHSNDMRALNMFDGCDAFHKEKTKIDRVTSRKGLEKLFFAALNRIPTLIKPLVANHGAFFGLGRVKLGFEGREHKIKPVRGVHSGFFNVVTRIKGAPELARARLNPRTVHLDSVSTQGGGPS